MKRGADTVIVCKELDAAATDCTGGNSGNALEW
jgi:hypothetical protein